MGKLKISKKYISKNYSKRPKDVKVDTIELLYSGNTANVDLVAKFFVNRKYQTSVNYLIGQDGKIFCIVPEKFRAWSSSSNKIDDHSITIMLCNSEIKYGEKYRNIISEHISSETESSLKLLCRDIMDRHNIDKLRFDNNLGNFRFYCPSMKCTYRLDSDEDIEKTFSNYPKNFWLTQNMDRIAEDINFNIIERRN